MGVWRRRWIGVLLCCACPLGAAPLGVSGTFHDSGRDVVLREAVALQEPDGIRVVLSEEPFDLFAFAADGAFDRRDIRRHRNEHAYATAEFVLTPAGQFRRLESSGVPDLEERRNPVGGWTLHSLDGAVLSASWVYGRSALRLALPLRGADLPLPGEEADASSPPAKTLTAYVEARYRGDGPALRALTATPAEIANLPAEIRAQQDSEAKALGRLMLHQLTIERVRIAGEIAEVDYRGKAASGKTAFRAFLARIDGQWLVRDVSDRQTERAAPTQP